MGASEDASYIRTMQAFAALLDRLILTPGRNAKLKLMADYFERKNTKFTRK